MVSEISTIKEYLLEYCSNRNIVPLSIILHGSQAINFANQNSDNDFLIISNGILEPDMDAFIHKEYGKIHIDFMNLEMLENKLINYETQLFKCNFDLNILAGRIFMGQIMFDTNHNMKSIIEKYKPYNKKKELIYKFYYQANNLYSDSKVTDPILKMYSFSRIAESLGIAYLISKNITLLNIKWQHRFLQDLLLKDEYMNYLDIRFYSDDFTDGVLQDKIKQFIKLIKIKE